jgi:hypothetical protein
VTAALLAWGNLVDAVNGRVSFGAVGVRDPEYPCSEYTATSYDGSGQCLSDGHYECKNCLHLSPDAPRFTQDRDGRRDRLLLFWRRNASASNTGGRST